MKTCTKPGQEMRRIQLEIPEEYALELEKLFEGVDIRTWKQFLGEAAAEHARTIRAGAAGRVIGHAADSNGSGFVQILSVGWSNAQQVAGIC